jgi:hypothetical protein
VRKLTASLNIALVLSLLVACGAPATAPPVAQQEAEEQIVEAMAEETPVPLSQPGLVERAYHDDLLGMLVPEAWDFMDESDQGLVSLGFLGERAALFLVVTEAGEEWSAEDMAVAADGFLQSIGASGAPPDIRSSTESFVEASFDDESRGQPVHSLSRITHSGRLLSVVSVLSVGDARSNWPWDPYEILDSYWINEDAWERWEISEDQIQELESGEFIGLHLAGTLKPGLCRLIAPVTTTVSQCWSWCWDYLNPRWSQLIPAGASLVALALKGKGVVLVLMSASGTTTVAVGPATALALGGATWALSTWIGCQIRCRWNSSSYDWARPPAPGPTPTPAPPDDWEPDDSLANAREIRTDGTPHGPHNLHVPRDHDYVFFQAQAGRGYDIETFQLGNDSLYTDVYLYSAQGNELASNDGGGREERASRILWDAPSDGTYYVMIRDLADNIAGPDVTYSIRVTAGSPYADQYEPDDTLSQASPISTDGTAQQHNLVHRAGDRDYISFQAQERAKYTIETSSLGSDTKTICIELYDPDRVQLSADCGYWTRGAYSRIEFTATSAGTHYVMVKSPSDQYLGADATYSVFVIAGEGDQYESDNTISEAKLLPESRRIRTDGTRQTHTFHTPTDVDFVPFTAQALVRYIIETGNLQGGCDTKIFLYSDLGSELAYDDDGADEARASRIEWTADSSGTYYVKVEEYDQLAGPDVSYDIWISK